ncbi:Gp37-like protein [Halalkalibacterium ligniniphilum]|uniref:Gp37-like protein n=1 Tax=Halalkalibacterium ligniniphilum TaxID=1134413 RepID=UPI000346838A|nr:hypothetical protein [Halalkalibacterium ligniniphilum]
MRPIRIIDTDFNLLAEIDDYESLIYHPCWHKKGDFELRININKRNTDALQKGNLIMLQSERTEETSVSRTENLKEGIQGLVVE